MCVCFGYFAVNVSNKNAAFVKPNLMLVDDKCLTDPAL